MQTTAQKIESRSSKYDPPANHEVITLGDALEFCDRPLARSNAQLTLWDSSRDSTDQKFCNTRIYYAGQLNLLRQPGVAVIGARKASEAGLKRARQFGRQLAERGLVVVSGLAAGIDTSALEGAIEAGGQVIAIIGTPLNKAYPAANKHLQERIWREHLLMSQFTDGSRVFPSNFPARNKTMAALTDASVVIEASDSSGTLHQAVECQRIGRWLGIAKNVVQDQSLSWPKKFLNYKKCIVLRSTDDFLETLYGTRC